jgi:hypothetical protein
MATRTPQPPATAGPRCQRELNSFVADCPIGSICNCSGGHRGDKGEVMAKKRKPKKTPKPLVPPGKRGGPHLK